MSTTLICADLHWLQIWLAAPHIRNDLPRCWGIPGQWRWPSGHAGSVELCAAPETQIRGFGHLGSQVAPLGRDVAHPDRAGCSQIPREMLASTLTHIHGISLLGWRLSKNSLAFLQRECQQPLNSTHFLPIKARSSSIAISGSSRELGGGWDLPPSTAWW